MKFIVFNDWAGLPQSSQILFKEAEKQSVFLSHEWFESLTPHISKQKQALLLACVIDEDDVLAILPLLTNENREWSSFTHPYSALFSMMLAADNQSEVLNCLAEGLQKLSFDYLTLAPIASNDQKLLQLQQIIEVRGIACYRSHKAHNWFHRIKNNQSFADYMAERPSRVRNTVLRKQRKLERDYDYTIQLFSDANIQQALSQYHNIYKVSWKANEQHQTLVEDVVQAFSTRAWPRLAIMSVDNKPIAAQLWFVAEGKASIFRLVYDEAWKDYSPGSILMTALLEHVIDTDKVKEIDFLSGNDTYKKDWMSERRERMTLVFQKKSNVTVKNQNNVLNIILKRFIKS